MNTGTKPDIQVRRATTTLTRHHYDVVTSTPCCQCLMSESHNHRTYMDPLSMSCVDRSGSGSRAYLVVFHPLASQSRRHESTTYSLSMAERNSNIWSRCKVSATAGASNAATHQLMSFLGKLLAHICLELLADVQEFVVEMLDRGVFVCRVFRRGVQRAAGPPCVRSREIREE